MRVFNNDSLYNKEAYQIVKSTMSDNLLYVNHATYCSTWNIEERGRPRGGVMPLGYKISYLARADLNPGPRPLKTKKALQGKRGVAPTFAMGPILINMYVHFVKIKILPKGHYV